MHAVIDSIQVGKKRIYQSDHGKSWESAIAKSTVAGPIAVLAENLEGDEQADRVHHGGPDKAILAYSRGHFDAWHQEFPNWSVTGGTFGENLTVEGVSESDLCIGDVFRVGTSVLQVSQPRQPCWKLSRKWNIPKLAVLVQKTGRTGWYLRVLQPGEVKSGDPFDLTERPYPGISVQRAHEIMHAKPRSSEDDLMLSRCELLSVSWREQLQARAMKGQSKSQSARLLGASDAEAKAPSQPTEKKDES